MLSDELVYNSGTGGVIFVSTRENRVTLAGLSINTGDKLFTSTGTSKRMPGDSRDPELGRLLALEEALEKLLKSVKSEITDRLI